MCTECKNEIDKPNLRIGGKTKNVVAQTSEVKEITVSKPEEGSKSIEKRLEDLSDLNEKGLIDDDDYESKKTEILKDM